MRILKFIGKSFLGGFFGSLGALSMLAVVLLIAGLIFGPSFTGRLSSLLDSAPSADTDARNTSPTNNDAPPISSNAPDENSGNNSNNFQPAPPMEPNMAPPMEIFLTLGDDPNGQHLTSFSSKDAQRVFFWVRSNETKSVDFELQITLPDHNQVKFGPIFTTDPSGSPVNCGQFGEANPSPGSYRLEAFPMDGSSTIGLLEFVITE